MEDDDRPTDRTSSGDLRPAFGPVARVGAGQIGWFCLATALLMLLLLFLPRANIVLTDWSFATTPCSPTTETRAVVATFTLRNSGNLEGALYVQLWVDGSIKAEKLFRVAAGQTIQDQITFTLPDCAYHRFSLETHIPEGQGY